MLMSAQGSLLCVLYSVLNNIYAGIGFVHLCNVRSITCVWIC